jgi:hypothetical protein
MTKCVHNRRPSRCVSCGGSSTCEHKRVRMNCPDCGGSQTCEHKKVRAWCKECKGSQICEHNNSRGKCVECGGKNICEHKKLRYHCKECKGDGICKHGKHRQICVLCKGSNICKHNKQSRGCKECYPLRWAVGRLAVSKADARRRNRALPKITAIELLSLIDVSKVCIGCGGLLDWDLSSSPHMHHNHVTGVVLGFCHSYCNQAEGMLSKMTVEERKTYIRNFFPEVFE